MAYPFFSLAKSRRVAPIDYRAGGISIHVEGTREHGLATISDFALDLRRIARRQPLPGYRLAIEREDGLEWLSFRPARMAQRDLRVLGLGDKL